MPKVAIALGSNLGDRAAHLTGALARLGAVLTNLRASSFHETVPVGVGEQQPMFLNAAAVGETDLTARALLDALLAIEAEHGRTRPHARAARTLDLDLILYDDEVIAEPELMIPHPRFRERRFVLEPLNEVAPAWKDPVTGQTISELLRLIAAR